MSVGVFPDLLGTSKPAFQIGIGGVRLENDSGNVVIRNPADDADAELTASKINVSGNTLVLNSDAAESANDWLLTLQRHATQTESLTVVFPPAKGTDGHHLRQKPGTASGVLELELVEGSAGGVSVDTTTLAFDDSSPVTMFELPDGAVIDRIQVIIDTPFDGAAPTMSVGVSGTASKYMTATENDLTAAAGTVFETHPGLDDQGAAEDLIITYAADSSAAGSARVLVYYSIPT